MLFFLLPLELDETEVGLGPVFTPSLLSAVTHRPPPAGCVATLQLRLEHREIPHPEFSADVQPRCRRGPRARGPARPVGRGGTTGFAGCFSPRARA